MGVPTALSPADAAGRGAWPDSHRIVPEAGAAGRPYPLPDAIGDDRPARSSRGRDRAAGTVSHRLAPEWGLMVEAEARRCMAGQWWVAFFPGLVIAVTVTGFYLIGDGLQDLLDPTRR
jgi:hypothetical protein